MQGASSYVALCSPAVSPLAPHWRKHSRTQVGYVLVVVAHGLDHLHARVKADRRFNGLVAKEAAHDLVATRVISQGYLLRRGSLPNGETDVL